MIFHTASKVGFARYTEGGKSGGSFQTSFCPLGMPGNAIVGIVPDSKVQSVIYITT